MCIKKIIIYFFSNFLMAQANFVDIAMVSLADFADFSLII